MLTFLISRSKLSFQFLIFLIPILYPVSSLSHLTLITGYPNFDPQIAILGDARISDNGSSMQLTDPHPSSSGLLIYKDPFILLSSSASKMMSFSTEFEFLFSGNAFNLYLIMGPFNFASKFLGQSPIGVSNEKGYLGIEFGASVDGNDIYSNTVHVSVTVNNGSYAHMVTRNGEKLNSWIDYDSSSKRLEFRLRKLGDKRPYDPIIAYSIDLSKMWQDKEVYVALGSKNGGNSSETCNVYSWRFRLRKIPNSMHSFPVDPHASMDHNGNESIKEHRKKFCPLTILGGMIFATGCGALLAFVVLFVWAIFVNRRTVFPIESNEQPVEFKYEKISVVVEKDGKVGKN